MEISIDAGADPIACASARATDVEAWIRGRTGLGGLTREITGTDVLVSCCAGLSHPTTFKTTARWMGAPNHHQPGANERLRASATAPPGPAVRSDDFCPSHMEDACGDIAASGRDVRVHDSPPGMVPTGPREASATGLARLGRGSPGGQRRGQSQLTVLVSGKGRSPSPDSD
jgi:hypothetical protein